MWPWKLRRRGDGCMCFVWLCAERTIPKRDMTAATGPSVIRWWTPVCPSSADKAVGTLLSPKVPLHAAIKGHVIDVCLFLLLNIKWDKSQADSSLCLWFKLMLSKTLWGIFLHRSTHLWGLLNTPNSWWETYWTYGTLDLSVSRQFLQMSWKYKIACETICWCCALDNDRGEVK